MSDLDDLFGKIEDHVGDQLEDLIFAATSSKYVVRINSDYYGPFVDKEAKRIWQEQLGQTSWPAEDDPSVWNEIKQGDIWYDIQLFILDDGIERVIKNLGAR